MFHVWNICKPSTFSFTFLKFTIHFSQSNGDALIHSFSSEIYLSWNFFSSINTCTKLYSWYYYVSYVRNLASLHILILRSQYSCFTFSDNWLKFKSVTLILLGLRSFYFVSCCCLQPRYIFLLKGKLKITFFRFVWLFFFSILLHLIRCSRGLSLKIVNRSRALQ